MLKADSEEGGFPYAWSDSNPSSDVLILSKVGSTVYLVGAVSVDGERFSRKAAAMEHATNLAKSNHSIYQKDTATGEWFQAI